MPGRVVRKMPTDSFNLLRKAINIDPTCPPSIERGVQRWRLPFARAGCGVADLRKPEKEKATEPERKADRHGTGRQKSARDTLETRARPDRTPAPTVSANPGETTLPFLHFQAAVGEVGRYIV